eukprot:jgi/Tetstr1/454989/TSEL_041849.t1
MALCMALKDGIHLRLLVDELLGRRTEEPLLLVEDNQSAISFANNSIINDRTKHIDVKYHFLKDHVHAGTVQLKASPPATAPSAVADAVVAGCCEEVGLDIASLSTDSYLVVDDRSAPLRSEDGVQHGAPLATTSFCVAIHPEVQQCDTTLEVNDAAARFNADDGFLVGLPEHVWPALHAFRTSIKASVGLKVRFDKMQAYNADMEAARREASADIEWPELDGHHGIAVLNVPLGSPEYVQAYMRGKAEDPREEVGASMSKLVSAKPSRRSGPYLAEAASTQLLPPAIMTTSSTMLMDGWEREVEAASGSQKELTAFLDQANNSRLRNEVCALPATCRERILFNLLDAASCIWTVAIPTARTAMTPHELREVAAGYFFLPSPWLAPVVGSQIILPSTEHNPVVVDRYGDALVNLPAPGDAHWRVQHDAIADAFRDHRVHDLGIGVRREVDDLFQQAVPLGNTVPMDKLKGLVPDAELSLPAFNVVTGSYPRSL